MSTETIFLLRRKVGDVMADARQEEAKRAPAGVFEQPDRPPGARPSEKNRAG